MVELIFVVVVVDSVVVSVYVSLLVKVVEETVPVDKLVGYSDRVC